MLKIWGRRNSFNVQKVMWLVAEVGLEHKRVDAGGDFGLLDSPDFRRLNPHGQIPVIEDGATVIWESHAILRYLAAAYGQKSAFWPDDPGARAAADQWMDWTLSKLQRDFMDFFWGWYRMPEAERDPVFVEDSFGRTNRDFLLLEGQLTGKDFLLGDRMSLADIAAGTALYRYFELGLEYPDLPGVRAWYDRLQARDAYRTHVMVPFGELYGRRRH
jgi:glutathione S-transferase